MSQLSIYWERALCYWPEQDGAIWLDAAKIVSIALGFDITAYCIGPEGNPIAPKGTFESAAGISSGGAILMRPDDFVAWRERRKPTNHSTQLDHAMRQALCL